MSTEYKHLIAVVCDWDLLSKSAWKRFYDSRSRPQSHAALTSQSRAALIKPQ
ncbi:hypothetical protein TorRG33x02_132380, partial [Trema orientale]